MKKIKYIIACLFLFIPQIVIASPNASISTSASSIEKGKSVTATVTLSDTAAWNIKINGSGAATCSQKQSDVTSDGKSTTKKFTLSCTSTSEGTITFTVTGDITSGSGQTRDISLNKQVTVTKTKSGDNTLSDIKVDGLSVSGFSSSKTSYTLKDNSGASISISATANDNKATVSGTGSKTLKYGKNTFSITVIAENGSKKVYTIIVNKPDPRSTNNYLKSLTVSAGTIEFNKNTTIYTVKLEHDVREIVISATAEDSKASISGTGAKTLKDYVNEFKIIVKAENGSTKIYTIKVIRKDQNGNYGKLNTDNSVKTITITNSEFTFDINKKTYNVLIDENADKLDITVVPNNTLSTISIQGNENLKPGLNKITVQVVSESGNINEYTFNVYKMGEGEKKESEVINTSLETKNTTSHINIWLIVSVIEFLIIIILIILLIKKSKKTDKEEKTDNKTYAQPNYMNESIANINDSQQSINDSNLI